MDGHSLLEAVGTWAAIIAAGGTTDSKLAHVAGERIKGLVRFGLSNCIEISVRACADAGIHNIVLVADEEVSQRVSLPSSLHVAAPGATSMESALNGVRLVHESAPLLFLPADLPLLRAEHIGLFISRISRRVSNTNGNWFVGGLVSKSALEDAFPGVPASFIRLRHGSFAAASLFAASREGVLEAMSHLEEFAARRKSKFRLIMRLGLWNLLKYAFGRVSVSEAEHVIGRILGGQAVVLTDLPPELAMDFDNPSDYLYLRRLFQGK